MNGLRTVSLLLLLFFPTYSSTDADEQPFFFSSCEVLKNTFFLKTFSFGKGDGLLISILLPSAIEGFAVLPLFLGLLVVFFFPPLFDGGIN